MTLDPEDASADAWLKSRDVGTRVILGELQDAARRAAELWAAAMASLGIDDDECLRSLTELQVLLESSLRLEFGDLLITAVEGSARLDQSMADASLRSPH